MHWRHVFVLLAVAGAAHLAGCASAKAGGRYDDFQEILTDRNLPVQENGETGSLISGEMSEPSGTVKLTERDAVREALLRNALLQAELESLGLAEANRDQAGRVKNPVLRANVRFPDREEGATAFEFEVVQDVLDILRMPLRHGAARARYEAERYRLAQKIVDFAADVEAQYRLLQALDADVRMTETAVRSYEYSAEFAQRQKQAGTINPLEEASRRAAYEKARLDLLRVQTERDREKERMARFLGWRETGTSWELDDFFTELPEKDPDLGDLEAAALQNRLDLAALRFEKEALEKGVSLERSRVLRDFGAGIDTERETDGTQLTGPVFEGEIPLFDQNQAMTHRAQAALRRSEKSIEALERQILEEVRTAHGRLRLARNQAQAYQSEIIPLQEKIVGEAQKEYNYMLSGLYALFQAKRDEIEARRGWIHAVKNYWIARIELTRAAGGLLPEGPGES